MTAKHPMKAPTTFQEQVDILKKRGLLIQDESKALHVLSKVNYYRLSAYWLTYQAGTRFVAGTSFDGIYSLYEFDRNLRSLLLSCLEAIEVGFRTQIAYTIAHAYGPLGHVDSRNFENPHYHAGMMEEIEKEVGRSKELFVRHHKEKYDRAFPIWVVVELMSFGTLSKMYSNVKLEIGKAIADTHYGVECGYVKNWFHALSIFRNICAHYGRIYNRTLAFKPKLLRRDKKHRIQNDSVFAILLIMSRLVDDDQWRSTVTQLAALIDACSEVDVKYLGFPINWAQILMVDMGATEDEVASSLDD